MFGDFMDFDTAHFVKGSQVGEPAASLVFKFGAGELKIAASPETIQRLSDELQAGGGAYVSLFVQRGKP